MKITFKDVGQGDSILLEWIDNDLNKLGIIDCSKKGRINPVLDYLKVSDYENIEFIVLSHPHSDHYSGMYELLSYCNSNSIKIGSFYHTSDVIGINYWKYFEIDSEDLEKLGILIRLIDELHEKSFLEIKYLREGQKIDLFPDAYLRCLSPSHTEIKECQKIMDFDPSTHKKEQSAAANYLSTIFKLKIQDHYALLTSDAENLAFQTILEKRNDLLKDKQLILSQMSHHGSYKNYEEKFWGSLKRKNNNPAVASSGKNDKYKHPNIETLKAFRKNNYSIHCTSPLYGMEEYIENLRSIRRIGAKMDTFSTEAEEYYHFGDQEFLWNSLKSEP